MRYHSSMNIYQYIYMAVSQLACLSIKQISTARQTIHFIHGFVRMCMYTQLYTKVRSKQSTRTRYRNKSQKKARATKPPTTARKIIPARNASVHSWHPLAIPPAYPDEHTAQSVVVRSVGWVGGGIHTRHTETERERKNDKRQGWVVSYMMPHPVD